MQIKEVFIAYCRSSRCPVQQTMDRHRQNNGSEDEIRMIKRAHCVRCDVWRVRKWMEAQNLEISPAEDEDSHPTY